ncbi:hypothetical protein EVAR_12499_1 [Eumeta japonica]|uniref:Uncharacterized protein n=1 Tax=Eumeta variegata TaxID=151549 RepID=A0A4C1TPK4_EUMVA|nr:hypothetical protein EVAR_12499_1 [Eumeta japonica]
MVLCTPSQQPESVLGDSTDYRRWGVGADNLCHIDISITMTRLQRTSLGWHRATRSGFEAATDKLGSSRAVCELRAFEATIMY